MTFSKELLQIACCSLLAVPGDAGRAAEEGEWDRSCTELVRRPPGLGTRARIQSCINALLLQVMLMSRLFTADADKQTGYGKTGAGAAICKITAENVEPCRKKTLHIKCSDPGVLGLIRQSWLVSLLKSTCSKAHLHFSVCFLLSLSLPPFILYTYSLIRHHSLMSAEDTYSTSHNDRQGFLFLSRLYVYIKKQGCKRIMRSRF